MPKLKSKKPKRKDRISINDPSLSEDARALLRLALQKFARTLPMPHDLSEKEMFDGVANLYEHGYLCLVSDGDDICVDLCLPNEAPQLRAA
jgi:hypothetical protein